jgi:hypothetical protein
MLDSGIEPIIPPLVITQLRPDDASLNEGNFNEE